MGLHLHAYHTASRIMRVSMLQHLAAVCFVRPALADSSCCLLISGFHVNIFNGASLYVLISSRLACLAVLHFALFLLPSPDSPSSSFLPPSLWRAYAQTRQAKI